MDPFTTEVLPNCPACICSNVYLDFLLVQQDGCPNKEGFCFKVKLYERNKFVELRDIKHEFKKAETINVLTTVENSDYKVEVVLS